MRRHKNRAECMRQQIVYVLGTHMLPSAGARAVGNIHKPETRYPPTPH